MKFKDISGQRYGRLFVISRASNVPIAGRPSGRTAWNCKCDCGNESVVTTGCLVYLGTRSCGCLRSEASRRSGQNRRIVDPDKLELSHKKRIRNQYKRHIKEKYGMTIDQYDAMVDSQNGMCSICKRTSKLHVDHCHRSGKVRELLCGPCNNALGLFQDDASVLHLAIAYIQKWR